MSAPYAIHFPAFRAKLEDSYERLDSDLATLWSIFPDAFDIRPATADEDRAGKDFIVSTTRGPIYVDVKTRTPDIRKHWKPNEHGEIVPDFSIETESVKNVKTGWSF